MASKSKEKGKRYDVGLLNGMHKHYSTNHKEEADELCKSLNERFEKELTSKTF